MKRLILATTMPLLLLTGCTFGEVASTPPAVVASRTVLDEQGVLAVELAYKAARLAVEAGVDAGAIKGETALRFADLDNKAFLAVTVARNAYAAGNAASYSDALVKGREAVTTLLSLTGK